MFALLSTRRSSWHAKNASYNEILQPMCYENLKLPNQWAPVITELYSLQFCILICRQDSDQVVPTIPLHVHKSGLQASRKLWLARLSPYCKDILLSMASVDISNRQLGCMSFGDPTWAVSDSPGSRISSSHRNRLEMGQGRRRG